MSNLQIIDELCHICSDLAHIIAVQRSVLEQHNALVAEDEIKNVRDRYNALIGADELPDVPEREVIDHD
ncbi:MAG: hypothetical protein K1W17_04140 [Oscillospiraceae bacterium]